MIEPFPYRPPVASLRSPALVTSQKTKEPMKILALVLAGGEGTRLHPLTADHCKPAVPFVNGYRIVDFVLSNLVNSGITGIYVMVQYKPASLIKHIESNWARRLIRKKGFIRPVAARADNGPGYYRGTADAVFQNLGLIERHSPDLVAVFAADHVYRMDIGQMALYHQACNADVTVAAVPVPIETASSFGVISTSAGGKIREFQEKPAKPQAIPGDPSRAYASMGNYLFDTNVLVGLLYAAERAGGTDFGRDLLPRLPGRGRIHAYDLSSNYVPGIQPHEEPAYWRDVGTLQALAAAKSDVQGPAPRFDLTNRYWPIHGEGRSLETPVRELRPRPVQPAVSATVELRAAG
jgi:glucose-1-phosphate adenylyltransferase